MTSSDLGNLVVAGVQNQQQAPPDSPFTSARNNHFSSTSSGEEPASPTVDPQEAEDEVAPLPPPPQRNGVLKQPSSPFDTKSNDNLNGSAGPRTVSFNLQLSTVREYELSETLESVDWESNAKCCSIQ